ncbi:MFS transporter [Pararobbsia silviterrae]|uniref:MFS transporter n=1 Tax=Pararobbsia silviterrae TaxID=1792498 RepID=A0A494Y6E2_9BURK|nr:MFS transporter [Pararobbsia silviterrae]RKP57652.1 MFS transporter [Pararobbsia silviterrae]
MATQIDPVSLPQLGERAHFEEATYRKVAWRLIPLLLLCYVVAYLDRVNVGFAKLQMSNDLHLSEAVYGLGAGIFFVGYFLFEVPSNLILHRVGARLWIARIMVTWGIVSGLTMFVTTPGWFYVMRFLLGVAEAGFFPGVILYLTYWFPAHRRARITARFISAVALSGIVGGPLSGFILKTLDGVNGWHGWQWLFLLEAVPSILVGVLVLLWLDDGIRDAKWLTANEQTLLARNLERDEIAKDVQAPRELFANPLMWIICIMHFAFVMGLYGVGFWLPTLIKGIGVADPFKIGVLSMIPYVVAVIAMIGVAKSADLRRERRWHLAVPGLVGAAGLVASVLLAGNAPLAMVALTIATAGLLTTFPLFWCLPTAMLTGAAAAAGIAFVNSIGNVAGFLGPYAVGWLKDATGSTAAGVYMLAAFMTFGALLALSLPASRVNR